MQGRGFNKRYGQSNGCCYTKLKGRADNKNVSTIVNQLLVNVC